MYDSFDLPRNQPALPISNILLISAKVVIYFGESKRSLKLRSDETEKNCWESGHNFSWDQTKVVDRENY